MEITNRGSKRRHWNFVKSDGHYIMEDVDAQLGGLDLSETPHFLANSTREYLKLIMSVSWMHMSVIVLGMSGYAQRLLITVSTTLISSS